MTADLTPPADAPLPWTLERGYIYSESRDTAEICDANGVAIWAGDALPYGIDSTIGTVARCLVACANAAPELVAEVERLTRWHAIDLDCLRDASAKVRGFIIDERDTALARVAELEAEATALREALIDTIALALDVRDLRRKLSAVRKVANDTSRPFDWSNVQAILDAAQEIP